MSKSRPWTDDEIDAAVELYFEMRIRDIKGQPYNKAQFNRDLQNRIDRGRGAIEWKFQNISAVLWGLGEDWIRGYKPASNFQNALVQAVLQRLEISDDTSRHRSWPDYGAGAGRLEIGMPPTMRNAPPPGDQKRLAEFARKFDVAKRDERNRALGRAGEERVLEHERACLEAEGKPDLARRVRWVSEEDGDGAGYDIQSFWPCGRCRCIEVKTTNGWERTPFHITRNEIRVSEERPRHWRLMRLWNCARDPQAFELCPPLEKHVALTPTSFSASFPET